MAAGELPANYIMSCPVGVGVAVSPAADDLPSEALYCVIKGKKRINI